MISFIKKLIILGVFIILNACVKNNFTQRNTMVPEVNVNTYIDAGFISIPSEFRIIPNRGHQGIIVFNIDGTNFLAFDLGCPYKNPSECNIPMQVDQGTGEMSCVGCSDDDIRFTQYKTGVVVNEKEYYLREYNAYLEGSVVRITNF